ncbi:MAG: 4-diphosphocytidyl-2C-methyl-D-erythritol kinase [Synergistaceae bacterium]|jgi:4-diphosphocytidyl-2-C-methyl-D-erythritol kinase|nr:4-diphosphocytidyl-2C-methyl-D-erythritol kinase [Synergistaceae bacterium]
MENYQKGISLLYKPVRFLQPCGAKINLSLRVTSLRPDGYHNILSLFLRLPSAEMLSISPASEGDSDKISVRGMEIEGENIVTRALRLAREAGVDVPFLEVEISKTLPPGSGLGAGSGNGAAMLRWLCGIVDDDRLWREIALKTGADVPFLFSGVSLARVSGAGEELKPLDPVALHVWVVFPDWSVGTENAYARLDHWYKNRYPLDEAAAQEESRMLLRRLRHREPIGFLPNDFAPELLEKFPEYKEIFSVLEKSGSCAWGITGSGGAAFALFYDAPSPLRSPWPRRVQRVFSVEIR